MSPEPRRRRGLAGRLLAPIDQWTANFVTHHTSTEWLVGLAIILLSAVVAFAPIGPAAALGAVVFAAVLHYVAMETGNHVWLWFATVVMLLFVIVAYATVLQPVGPVALAVGGALTLAYNESVRLNYFRRRNAVVDGSTLVGSAVAIVVSAVVGAAGIAVSVVLSTQAGRSWVWMPATVVTLLVVGYAATLLPARRAPRSSTERWEPGTRIPPQPLLADDDQRPERPAPPA